MATPADMFKLENQGDITIMVLTLNDFLHEDNEKLMQSIDELFNKGTKKLILDLVTTTYVSSLILASLVYIQKRAKDAGGDLVFCNVKERVQEIMAMTNLDKIFNIKASRPDAIAALSKSKG